MITISASEFMSHCFKPPRAPQPSACSVSTLRAPLGHRRGGRCAQRPARRHGSSRSGYSTDRLELVLGCLRRRSSAEHPAASSPQHSPAGRLRARRLHYRPLGQAGRRSTSTRLSYVGPSQRFKLIRELATSQGRDVYAKLQIGTTHEIASVSNLPLIPRLYRKASAFRRLGLGGFMGCWSFGNMLSLNTRAFNAFLEPGARSRRRGPRRLGREGIPGV